MHNRARQRGSHMGLLLLASQVYQVGLDNIPPVTLGVLALNVYLFLFPFAPLRQTCISVEHAYWNRDLRRLLLSPLHHADDWHLYFNMVSLIMKGIKLERRLGSGWFVYMLSVFSLLTGVVYVALEAALAKLTQDQSHSLVCAVGFSGVLFALKVLNNHYHPGGVTYVMNFPVPNRYASWVELVLIHLTAPGTSFVGHLAGILVGLLYTMGPLKKVMKKCAEFVTSNGNNFTSSNFYRSSGYSGTSGGNSYYHPHADTADSSIYSDGMAEEEQLEHAIRNSLNDRGYSGTSGGNSYYHPHADTADSSTYSGMTEEEQLAQAIRNSLNDRGPNGQSGAPPPYGFNLPEADASAEELRWRRMRRFDR